jgi:hypothetical protein
MQGANVLGAKLEKKGWAQSVHLNFKKYEAVLRAKNNGHLKVIILRSA